MSLETTMLCALPDYADAPQTPLPPGTLAPDFTLPAAGKGGADVTLSALRGQPVVLAFASDEWDPARVEQRAQINSLLSQSDGPQAELLELTRDGVWYGMAFAEERVQFPVLADLAPQGAVAYQYGVRGGQAWFVVDAEGVIRWSFTAPAGGSPSPEAVGSALRALSPEPSAKGISRRDFLAATLAGALALSISLPRARAASGPALAGTVDGGMAATVPVTLAVNGTAHKLNLEPRVTLLDALRERIGLTGSKKGCDHGQCGACTVLVDGRRVNSCLSLAVMQQGKKITTIEGLAKGDTLHPMQAAFVAHDGFQCGYCTPGQITSAVGLLSEPCGPSDADVRESMSGNICRCGAYPNIVAAVQDVRKGGKRDASV